MKYDHFVMTRHRDVVHYACKQKRWEFVGGVAYGLRCEPGGMWAEMADHAYAVKSVPGPATCLWCVGGVAYERF